MVHKTDSTVLNMEILGSKSNGIVTWGNTSDSGCKNTFNESIKFLLNSGEYSLGSALRSLLHQEAHLCQGSGL